MRFATLSTTLVALVVTASCGQCGGAPSRAQSVPAVSGVAATPEVTNGPTDRAPFAFGGGDWEWESRGIGGGGAFLAASFNPHDPNDLVVSTDMGAAYRSTDFGRSWWAWRFDSLRGGDRAVLHWTGRPGRVFTINNRGWEGASPLASNDDGRTWQPLAADPTGGEAWWLTTDPLRDGRVLLAGWAELWISTDDGQSFASIATAADLGAGLYVAGAVWTADHVWVATGRGILRVALQTGDVETLNAALPEDLVPGSFAGVATDSGVRVWATARPRENVWPGIRANQTAHFRGLYRADFTLDGGAEPSWQRLDTPPGVDAFLVAAGSADRVYLSGNDEAGSEPVVLRSDDGGDTWASAFNTVDNANILTGWCGAGGDLPFGWGGAPLSLAMSPTDPDRLAIADYGFVHVSADGGASWRQAYVNVQDQNPAGSRTPTQRGYRGVGLEDTSAWWLHWSDADTVFAAFSDIRGIWSDDGGERWRAGTTSGLPHNSTYHVVARPSGQLLGATASIHDIYQSTHLTDASIDGGEGAVVVSDDGGRTWNVRASLPHPVMWLALDPTDDGRVYAAVANGENGGIWRTDDIDAPRVEWRSLATPPRTEGHPAEVHRLNDGALVAVFAGHMANDAFTESSGVFVSVDGGATWTDRSHPDMRRWTKSITVDPHDPAQSTWYASVFSHWGAPPNEVGGVFRTRDRGVNWERVSTDLYRVESVTIDPEDASRAYAATETQGLWWTSSLDAASPTWRPVLTYPFEHPTRVFFAPHGGEVWATSFGGGLRVLRP